LADGDQTNLVYGAFGTHSFKRKKELLADIYDLSGEGSPLGLGLDKCTLGVLFFLLKDHIVLLEKHELLLQLLHLDIIKGATAEGIIAHDLLFFEICVPMENLWRLKFWQIIFQPIGQLIFEAICPLSSAK
jgi:hypothetical protein